MSTPDHRAILAHRGEDVLEPSFLDVRYTAASDLRAELLEEVREVLMLDVARIVRTLLPAAEAILIDDSDRRKKCPGLWLHDVLDRDGAGLLIEGQPPCTPSPGPTWDDIRALLEDMLLEYLDHTDAEDHWEQVPGYLFRVELPSRRDVRDALHGGRGVLRRVAYTAARVLLNAALRR